MTDSKTPEWAREAAQAFHDKWETGMSGAAFRDFAQALLSAYARGRAEREWQDISTAPKDGRKFIAGRFAPDGDKSQPNNLVAVDRWHKMPEDGYTGLGQFNNQYWPATHWMPLQPRRTTMSGEAPKTNAVESFDFEWDPILSKALSDAKQRSYERGRKEGIEEAAKVTEAVAKTYLPGGPMDAKGGLLLGATAIRQLLEGKSEDRVEKPENT